MRPNTGNLTFGCDYSTGTLHLQLIIVEENNEVFTLLTRVVEPDFLARAGAGEKEPAQACYSSCSNSYNNPYLSPTEWDILQLVLWSRSRTFLLELEPVNYNNCYTN